MKRSFIPLQDLREDQRALLQRKMEDPKRHHPHTGQRWVGCPDMARFACQIKLDQTERNSEVLNLWSLNLGTCLMRLSPYHMQVGACILVNLMYFIKLSTCMYAFWSHPSLTVIRLIGEDLRCFGHRLGLTIHYLKICVCVCVHFAELLASDQEIQCDCLTYQTMYGHRLFPWI